jgi:pimeloyl-ACP methyl ester carboxylesterase
MTNSERPAEPDGVEHFEVLSEDGATIRGRRRPGANGTVVLVPGVAMDSQVWPDSGLLDTLPHTETIMIDLRGRGDSERVGEPHRHTLGHYVADVRAVLDRFPRPAYDILGLYYGGRIAFGVAERDTRVRRAFSFCAHAETVELPPEDVVAEAEAIGGPDGVAYLRDHFANAGAPEWMVRACERVDRAELAAATRGLLHDSGRGAATRHPGQEYVLITAAGDRDMSAFHAGQIRLGAQLWLVDAPTRIRAAGGLTTVGHRMAELLGELRGVS